MTRLFASNCPDWSTDGPETREGNFRRSSADAYRAVQAAARRKMVDSPMCCGWHRTMFVHHVPLDYYAGNYRQVDPSRPCLEKNVEVSGIAGAPYNIVDSEMRRLFDVARLHLISLEINWPRLSPNERSKRLAIILAMMIGRFIQIHPFVNGNGRVSRLLWAWGLIRFGVPPQLRVRRHPEHPKYNSVMAKAMQGDFSPLALFIITHLARHAHNPPIVQE